MGISKPCQCIEKSSGSRFSTTRRTRSPWVTSMVGPGIVPLNPQQSTVRPGRKSRLTGSATRWNSRTPFASIRRGGKGRQIGGHDRHRCGRLARTVHAAAFTRGGFARGRGRPGARQRRFEKAPAVGSHVVAPPRAPPEAAPGASETAAEDAIGPAGHARSTRCARRLLESESEDEERRREADQQRSGGGKPLGRNTGACGRTGLAGSGAASGRGCGVRDTTSDST